MEVSDTEVLDTEVSDTDVSEGYAGCQEARGRVGFARGFNIRCVFYKKSSVKPSESCIEAVSSAFVRKGIQKAPLFLASKIGTKRSICVEGAITRTLIDPTRTQTQTPGQRQIRDTEETKRSVSVEGSGHAKLTHHPLVSHPRVKFREGCRPSKLTRPLVSNPRGNLEKEVAIPT